MRKLFLFLSILIYCSSFINAQTNKDTEKIKKLYFSEKYEKALKYKSSKEHILNADGLYFKGLSAYNLSKDNKAKKYFELSIIFDPTNSNAYFYKGISEYYLKEYEESINSINKAINLCDTISSYHGMKGEVYLLLEKNDSAIISFQKALKLPNSTDLTYVSLANAFFSEKMYDSAVHYYDQALSIFDQKEETYKNCSYNKGLAYYQNEEFDKSLGVFKNHLEMFPNDYFASIKCIQNIIAKGNSDDHLKYIDQLYAAKKDKLLPRNIRNMFSFHQFMWKDYKIIGFELFEEKESPIVACKHKYLAFSKEDSLSFKFYSERDTSVTGNKYRLKLMRNDSAFIYQSFEYKGKNYYSELTNHVLKILDSKIQPDLVIPNYKEFIDKAVAEKYNLSKLTNDGSSYAKAVKVNSVSEEYKWLKKYYPGYIFHKQALVFNENSPYDILYIEVDGVKKEVYFDISSFFGKGY